MVDAVDEPLSRTYYFYPTLDENVPVSILTSRLMIEEILESHRLIQ